MKIETKNNRTEDTYTCRTRENNQIKNFHVKEEMSNILDSIEAGAYCTTARFSSITLFAPADCVCYHYWHSLPLTAFDIIATRFAAPTKNIIISKYFQLTPLVDDYLTP